MGLNMEKSIKIEVQPSQDEFVNELRQQKFEAGQKLAVQKSELSRLEADQRKLKTLLDAEKHQNQGGHKKHKKAKGHENNKAIRLDIVKNEQKFKDQESKIAQIRKEIQHLEMELKSLTHDLAVVEQSH